MAGSLFRVVPSGSWLFCLWLSGCWAVWRYRTRIGSYILFTTRTTIYLEYEGTAFMEWDIPILCSAEDERSPQTTMICSVAGTHRIMPVVLTPTFEDRERYLTVGADLNCFLWYDYSIHSSTNRTNHNTNEDLIVWIYDPENADASEVNRIASKPPTYSRALSKQFANLGQIPAVKTHLRSIEFTDAQFMDEGFWKIQVKTGLEDIIAHIHGKTVTFQGCFVAPSPIVIPEPQTLFPDVYDISISSPIGSDTMVIWAACFPTTALLLTDVGVFCTSNGFQTWEEIKFPSTVLDRAMAHRVRDAAIVFHYIFFLIEDVVYVSDNGDFYRVGEDNSFPENGVIGIRSRTWCELIYPEADTVLSVLLVWTEHVIYFISASHGHHFTVLLATSVRTLKKLAKLEEDVDLTIINACYDSVPSEVSVLVACVGCSSTRTLYLVAYDEVMSHWFLRDFSLPATTVKAMDIEVMPSARSDMLLWDSDKVYYTYKANRVNGYMMVAGTDKILSAASEGTTIHQIIIDFDGNTVIKMKNNMLFSLKFNMKDVIKLNLWENESKQFILYVNPLSDLYLLTINGSNIVRQIYPLKIEIFSATYASDEVCPYISFQHSVKLNVYYVDKGENVTFWTQIVFLENLGLSTEVTIYRPELLKRKSDLQYEIARGICTKNETTIFYHEHDYSKENNYQDAILFSEGVMAVDLRPSATGRTCLSNNKLFFIVIGCSPYRHIDVEKPSNCKKENFIVSIPEEYLWIKTHGRELEIEYNMKKFGCPIEAYYGDPFRPTVVLYERDSPTKIVQANYILWEINNRKDFKYNSTMEQVQCLREAQSWFSMGSKKTENISNVWIDDFWGPQIWQYGQWLDVVVDDRLPTKNGQLLFLHSEEGNEFWSALLEKAYAKLNGSYEALTGGSPLEGFEDFTGGICESYDLRKAPPNLYQIIQKGLQAGSLFGCSIDITSAAETEAMTRLKLVKGHAYSITGAEEVNYRGKPEKLLRIRNPWGEVEWTGAWSDNSPEWNYIDPKQKSALDKQADDGEFWMSFADFQKQFTRLDICSLTPDALASDHLHKWSMTLFNGSWRRGSTAGGCQNYPATYWTNPQFKIRLDEPDDDHDGSASEPCCTVLVGLMQKNRRREKRMGEGLLSIGYSMYQVPKELESQTDVHLGRDFFSTNRPVARSDTYVNLRGISGRFHLPQGEYLIVPSTFEPFRDGEFCLRVFSEKQAKAQEIGDTVAANPYEPHVEDKEIDSEFKSLFQKLSGEDCELTANELQTILNRVISKRRDVKSDGFNINTCREMISLLDNDGTGTLGLIQFKILWMKIQKYLEIYKKVDADYSGTIDAHEMRNALKEAGFTLNNKVQQSLVLRYACSKLTIDFDGFLACMIRLETLFKMFHMLDKDRHGTVQLSLAEIIQWNAANLAALLHAQEDNGSVKGWGGGSGYVVHWCKELILEFI